MAKRCFCHRPKEYNTNLAKNIEKSTYPNQRIKRKVLSTTCLDLATKPPGHTSAANCTGLVKNTGWDCAHKDRGPHGVADESQSGGRRLDHGSEFARRQWS